MIIKALILSLLLVLPGQKAQAQIVVSPEMATIEVNQTVQLTVSPPSSGVQWTSANPAIATVNQSGLVTGISAGTVTIRAKLRGDRDTATITVTGGPPPPPPPGPSVSVSPTSVVVGGSVTASFSGIANPSPTDWLAVAPAGADVHTYGPWIYAGSCTQSPTIAKASGSCTFSVAPNPAGSYEVRLFENDQYVMLATTPLIITDSEPPPPPPPTERGPQPTIACPAGAVDIFPGQNPSAIVGQFGPGTSFCLRAGTYVLANPLYMDSGDVLTGEFGAYLDGTNVTQDFDVLGTSVISGWNRTAANVQIRNVKVTGRDTIQCIAAYGNTAGSWTLDHVEIANCRWGPNFGTTWQGTFDNKVYVPGVLVQNSYVHHNIWSGATGSNGSGGYGIQNTDGTQFINNEFAYNGGQPKFTGTIRTVVRGNYFHHNEVAIWYDGDNLEGLIEDNVCEDQTSECIFYEISASGIIRNNTIKRSGTSGIFVSTSRQVEVYGNVLEDNWRDINLFLGCHAAGKPAGFFYPTSIAYDLADVNVHDNTIRMGTRAGTITGAFSWGGSPESPCTPEFIAPYFNPTGPKNIGFQNNHWFLFDIGASAWLWDANFRTWTGWQALGQDTTGTINVR